MTSSQGATAAMTTRSSRPVLGWLDWLLLVMVASAAAYTLSRVNTVLHYKWDWGVVASYLVKTNPETGRWVPNVLLEGLFTTIRLSVWGIVLAAMVGLVMGMARCSDRLFPRLVSGVYVLLVRNVPPLVFVFIVVFFVGSQVLPMLGLSSAIDRASPTVQYWVSILFAPAQQIENFVAGLVCLAFFTGAYVTEIVRAGIQSVPTNQIEAGRSLGLSRLQIMRLVVLPQALRNVLPPLAGQFIQMIKDSSLVSLVSVQELTFVAQEIQVSTQKVFEVLLFAGGLYFIICYSLSLLFAFLEHRSKEVR